MLSTCEELSTYEDKIESVVGDALIDIVNHDHAFTKRNREGEGERENFFFCQSRHNLSMDRFLQRKCFGSYLKAES